ncbi:MAG: hypothetical protein LBH14_03640 [Desulfobulbaceae bacterium]|jgi:hypothetical protein|nr:hypothetical protein [Desulfobulbaceae bacterium]
MKWEVFNNPGFGYFVARIKYPDEPLHSGNIERNIERFNDEFYRDQAEALALAAAANHEEMA